MSLCESLTHQYSSSSLPLRCFNPDLSITVRSAYGAEEGDSVSLCYTDSLWTTAARRENLVYSKVREKSLLAASLTDLLQDFLCNCDRCADETENETYLSALRCVKCPGYFLPRNPLGKKQTAPVRVASLHKKNL